jgi:copper chaperone
MTQTLNVKGMTCGHCERTVTEAIQSVDPDAQIKIDRTSGKVEVQTTESIDAIAKAIAEEGYAVQ